jgi:glutamine synthetase
MHWNMQKRQTILNKINNILINCNEKNIILYKHIFVYNNIMTTVLEYIWYDSNEKLRSKIKVINGIIELKNNIGDKVVDALDLIPIWTFDGSSTGQAKGFDSDVLLKPVYLSNNPFVSYCKSYIVLCECYNKDKTPHESNSRIKLVETYMKCEKEHVLIGFEQEYVLLNKNKPKCENNYEDIHLYKWVNNTTPTLNSEKNDYYCGVGSLNCIGRDFSNVHLELCIKAGLLICGTNTEVLASQHEYQIGPLNPIELSDQVTISRYILYRVSELFDNCVVTLEPKPINGWNGSGGHINFSTENMRKENGVEFIINACEKLSLTHNKHMEVYGKDNDKRMIGNYETSNMTTFSWGISDRGKSVRIPLLVNENKCGYLEDRRPASNVNLYLANEVLLESICL